MRFQIEKWFLFQVPKYVLENIEPNTNFQRTNALFHQILTGGIELAKDLPTEEAESHLQGQIEQFFPLKSGSTNNNIVWIQPEYNYICKKLWLIFVISSFSCDIQAKKKII